MRFGASASPRRGVLAGPKMKLSTRDYLPETMSTQTQSLFFRIDQRGWPCVRISFSRMPQDLAEYKTFLVELGKCYETKQKFTMLFDTKNITQVPIAYAKLLAQYMQEKEALTRQYLDKTAVIVENSFVRNFLRITFVLRKPTSPMEIFENMKDACTWLGWREVRAARLRARLEESKM